MFVDKHSVQLGVRSGNDGVEEGGCEFASHNDALLFFLVVVWVHKGSIDWVYGGGLSLQGAGVEQFQREEHQREFYLADGRVEQAQLLPAVVSYILRLALGGDIVEFCVGLQWCILQGEAIDNLKVLPLSGVASWADCLLSGDQGELHIQFHAGHNQGAQLPHEWGGAGVLTEGHQDRQTLRHGHLRATLQEKSHERSLCRRHHRQQRVRTTERARVLLLERYAQVLPGASAVHLELRGPVTPGQCGHVHTHVLWENGQEKDLCEDAHPETASKENGRTEEEHGQFERKSARRLTLSQRV